MCCKGGFIDVKVEQRSYPERQVQGISCEPHYSSILLDIVSRTPYVTGVHWIFSGHPGVGYIKIFCAPGVQNSFFLKTVEDYDTKLKVLPGLGRHVLYMTMFDYVRVSTILSHLLHLPKLIYT
jgi:hypothetical protein